MIQKACPYTSTQDSSSLASWNDDNNYNNYSEAIRNIQFQIQMLPAGTQGYQ